MPSLTITDAFKAYGATPTNVRWSMCAFAPDGNLVVCLWQNFIKTERRKDGSVMVYTDELDKWQGNEPGRNEFAQALITARAQGTRLRLIVALPKTPEDAQLVGKVPDESIIKKDFDVRDDIFGDVVLFDGNAVRLEFRRVR